MKVDKRLLATRELQDWLADCLEASAELNPEFVVSIERAMHA